MSTKGCGQRDKRAGRRFRTGIDLRPVSGVAIKQNNQRFMACTLHVRSIGCSQAGVMDSVVSSSSTGSVLRGLFSVKSQTVYNAGPCISGRLQSLFTLSGKDPQTH